MSIKISDDALKEFVRLHEKHVGVTLGADSAAQLAEKLVLLVATVCPSKT